MDTERKHQSHVIWIDVETVYRKHSHRMKRQYLDMLLRIVALPDDGMVVAFILPLLEIIASAPTTIVYDILEGRRIRAGK